jgi:hypothetical protein
MRLGSSTTPQRARLNRRPGSVLSPVKRKFKALLSPGKAMATVFWVFTEFFWWISRLPVQQYVNAAAYQETLKRLKEAIRHKRPVLLTKGLGSSSSAQCSTSQCCCNCESLEILELGNSSTSTIQS